MIKISEISVSDIGIGIGIIGYRKILKYLISVSDKKCDIGPSLIVSNQLAASRHWANSICGTVFPLNQPCVLPAGHHLSPYGRDIHSKLVHPERVTQYKYLPQNTRNIGTLQLTKTISPGCVF